MKSSQQMQRTKWEKKKLFLIATRPIHVVDSSLICLPFKYKSIVASICAVVITYIEQSHVYYFTNSKFRRFSALESVHTYTLRHTIVFNEQCSCATLTGPKTVTNTGIIIYIFGRSDSSITERKKKCFFSVFFWDSARSCNASYRPTLCVCAVQLI